MKPDVFFGTEDFAFSGIVAWQYLHLMLRAWLVLPHFGQILVGAFFAIITPFAYTTLIDPDNTIRQMIFFKWTIKTMIIGKKTYQMENFKKRKQGEMGKRGIGWFFYL
jgi:hypothetical protein